MSSHAANTQVNLPSLGALPLDFRGGFRSWVDREIQSGWGGVKLKLDAFEMSADSQSVGKVTLTATGDDTTELSPVYILDNPESTYQGIWHFNWKMVIEKPPGGGGPMQMCSVQTAVLVNDRLTAFPPQGAVYRLKQPVAFARADAPNEIVASIHTFDATVAHNP
ncbi:hypothetical protein QA860_25650 [Streptomyces stelliscabiei]|uniref:hypothetical protein n=1 Tax=Streptomyces stelliscabiei TaxID=146820 RepID=UPI002FEF1065